MAKKRMRHPWAPEATWPLAPDYRGRKPTRGWQRGENAFGVDERTRGSGPSPANEAAWPHDPYPDHVERPRGYRYGDGSGGW
jgi:hypothetical protein